MSFLSLKEVLAGCLEALLFGNCEDNPIHFMMSSYKTGAQKPFFSEITRSQPVHWRNIPIEKKKTPGPILYTSALPQVMARAAVAFENVTLSEISAHLVNQLNQHQFQPLNSDFDHDDDLLFFVLQLWSEFKIETQRPGWLALHLSNQGIDLWIQHHQKVFQTNHKHTQLFLHYGCLSQMSYSLFESVDQADRDHNNSTLKLSNQHRNQDTFTHNLSGSLAQPPASKGIPRQGVPSTRPSNHGLPHQKSKPQLIPTKPTSHRQAAGPRPPAQPSLSSKQKQLAENWLWQVQYTYARCCSVIQRWESAQADTTIGCSSQKALAPAPLTTQRLKPAVSIDTSPQSAAQPIPLAQHSDSRHTSNRDSSKNRAGNTSQEHKRQVHKRQAQQKQAQQRTTQQLITSLIEVTDNLFWIPYRWPSQQYFLLLKGTSPLCQAFEAFSSHCLVGFGQVSKAEDPRDSLEVTKSTRVHFQNRVDLVVATQNILKVLLEVYLEESAPTEL